MKKDGPLEEEKNTSFSRWIKDSKGLIEDEQYARFTKLKKSISIYSTARVSSVSDEFSAYFTLAFRSKGAE